MSLKFAAVGNLMALSAFENRALVEDRFKTPSPIETYDPLLAMIGRGRRTDPPSLSRRENRRPGSLVTRGARRGGHFAHLPTLRQRCPNPPLS